jgi:hypothetical protein
MQHATQRLQSVRLALIGQARGKKKHPIPAALVIHPSILTLSSQHTVGKDMCIYSLQLQNGTLHLLYTKPRSLKE